MVLDLSADAKRVDVVARTVDEVKKIFVTSPNAVVGVPALELRQVSLDRIMDFSRRHQIEVRY